MSVNGINILFLMIAAALVFFMQAGFSMLEAGLTRAKNAGNVMIKNIAGFSIVCIAFIFAGFGLMHGNGNLIIGDIAGIASTANYGTDMLPEGVPFYLFLTVHTFFAAAAVAVMSGGMSERIKLSSYFICSLCMALLVYPLEARWIWNGQGWLSRLGFHDLAGGTVIHICGGSAALLGAWFLGPRTGKYGKSGKPRAIQGHNIPLAALGYFILWFGWIGFIGNTVHNDIWDMGGTLGKAWVNMNLSAAVCVCTVMLTTWLKYGKPDVSLSLNGILTGLVVSSAGADTVSPLSMSLTAVIAGVGMVFAIEYIDEVLKIDDPVGAFAVHGLGGALGTIAVGLFSDGTGTNGVRGLLLGGGFRLLGIQLLGAAAVMAWVCGVMYLVFKEVKKRNGLRVSLEDEMSGLDASEHGLNSSYPNFAILPDPTEYYYEEKRIRQLNLENRKTNKETAAEQKKMPEKEPAVSSTARKLTQITVICNQAKMEALKEGLNDIGITGITVANVLGCGVQKGRTRFFRGIPVGMQLLPKVRIDIVVAKVSVEKIIEVTRDILYTGNIGDGKIFVYDVENVIKVRTGEEGYAALQYSDVIWDDTAEQIIKGKQEE